MYLSEVIALSQEVELKHLKCRDDKTAIMGFINNGILEIHKRFPLMVDEAIITMATDVDTYTLDGIDGNVSIDLTNKELMVITDAYDSDGYRLTVNGLRNDLDGVTTPSFNKIKVRTITPNATISVGFRAAPVFALYEKTVLPLPMQFITPLRNWIAYEGHGTKSGDVKAENNTHYIRFESSCKKIIAEGLYNQDELDSEKFYNKGFV